MRVMLDTNVLISLFVFSTPSMDQLLACLDCNPALIVLRFPLWKVTR